MAADMTNIPDSYCAGMVICAECGAVELGYPNMRCPECCAIMTLSHNIPYDQQVAFALMLGDLVSVRFLWDMTETG